MKGILQKAYNNHITNLAIPRIAMEDNILAVSIVEAARRLSVCSRTVTNLIRTKQLVSRKIGRRRVVPTASLEAFIRHDHETGRTRCSERKRHIP